MTGIGNSRFDPQGFSRAIAALPTHIILLVLSAIVTKLWKNMHCTCLTKFLLIHFFKLWKLFSRCLVIIKNHLPCTDNYLNIHFCLRNEISLLLFYRHRTATVTGNAVTSENYNNVNTPSTVLIHSVWPPRVELHQNWKRLLTLRQAPNFWFSLWWNREKERKKIVDLR